MTGSLEGDGEGLLMIDAHQFMASNTVSGNRLSLPHLTLPEETTSWMRSGTEQDLADVLSQAFDCIDKQFKPLHHLTQPTTSDLCSNDSSGLQGSSMLRVCWEECGGSHLSASQGRGNGTRSTRLDWTFERSRSSQTSRLREQR